jgi:hypothetical protein
MKRIGGRVPHPNAITQSTCWIADTTGSIVVREEGSIQEERQMGAYL